MVQIVPAEPSHLDAIAACARAAYEKYVARIGREPAPMVADFASSFAAGHVRVAVDGEGSRASLSSTRAAIISTLKTWRCFPTARAAASAGH